MNSVEKGPILKAPPVNRLPWALVVTEDVVFPETVFIVVACVAWVKPEDAEPASQRLDERGCGRA